MARTIDPSDVHFRVAGLSIFDAFVVCVQDFEYAEFPGFVTEELFSERQDAEDWRLTAKVKMTAFRYPEKDLVDIIERQRARIKELEV